MVGNNGIITLSFGMYANYLLRQALWSI